MICSTFIKIYSTFIEINECTMYNAIGLGQIQY